MWDQPPEPLSKRQRATVVVLSLLVAASRFATVSRAPWEWDEILFVFGVRDYDVGIHHPHPPGFPLFIGAAKLIAATGLTEFRALQTVVIAGAVLLFPLVFLLGRELRFSFGASIGGALIVSFAPNVWYYGGTAFSDVPGLALVLASSVLLLRGPREQQCFVAGCILLGIAIGFRPQLLLIAAMPFVIVVSRVAHRAVFTGVTVMVVLAAASYSGAALASSSVDGYLTAFREQQEYVSRVDSYRSPTRPGLVSLMRTFFKPTRGGGAADKLIALLAAAGLAAGIARRHRGVWLLVAMFGPVALLSWLMFDLNAASRYVVAYVPMFAILFAYALESIARRQSVAVVVCAAAAAWFVVSAWPSLRRVSQEQPPLLEAMAVLPENSPGTTVYATPGVVPFAEYFLPRHRITDLTVEPVGLDGYLLLDALSAAPCARNFVRERGKLADIARARYFEASVVPARGCQ